MVLCLAAAVLVAFAPTYIKLINGPWRTEQEGHGPLIILVAGWLTWQRRSRLLTLESSPAPFSGWVILLSGLIILIVAQSQDVLLLEVLVQIPIICGCVILAAGWKAMRALAFPVAFLLFSAPPPGWMMDAVTVPLKVAISDAVTQILYTLDFPVAQNGVMIMIGPYQLMVKDACAGMNSILALSAIGVFYIHEFVSNSKFRMAMLILAIIPITVAANFVRVLALVLIAHYFGSDAVEGVYHDMTGIFLFVVALILFFALDSVLLAATRLLPRRKPPALAH
jgi:exosortase B